MELSKQYQPSEIEEKWYAEWEKNELFKSTPDDREPFTIVIPPPNVTGVLHMGHMLNATIQDVLIRKARMDGKNACWVPGTDHASIATEAMVVGLLREQGIKKSDLSREEFLEHAFAWKDKYGGIINSQLKKLGASCDWSRERFTMEPDLSEAVVDVFIHLFKKGYLYRDLKMVNWDPEAKTTLSNEEVIHKEEQSKLYYLEYKVEDGGKITIATTRPETILGDSAICVHPDDERFKSLVGKHAFVPLIDRRIPIIADDYVDIEFGTGALKITPAHDANDYEIGKRHGLATIEILNDDGSLNDSAEILIGEDRFSARKKIIPMLEEGGQLVKLEEISNKVGYSERTNSVVEPKLSLQWFVDMQKLVGPAIEHVMNNDIVFHPKKYKNVYKHWMENIVDWPISRQLWWGQQIPAYYHDDEVFVAKTREDAESQAKEKLGSSFDPSKLKRDEDVVDTWFSSWLWPITVFDGMKQDGSKEFDYYYPTSVLVTGWDIIFFWVARMVIAGYELKDEKPFEKVYFTGMVRDLQRRKMSKSLGNSPDALDLISIFGADGVRFGMMACSPAGNDLLFDEKLCEQGRNFCNKLWNALRLLKGWDVEEKESGSNEIAIQWIESKFNECIKGVKESIDNFRLSEALMNLYRFTWNDFCSWYLEMIKPTYGDSIDHKTIEFTIGLYEEICAALHPYMPFITEEIFQQLSERTSSDFLTVSAYPTSKEYNDQILKDGDEAIQIITKIREIRAKQQLKNKETVDVFTKDEDKLNSLSFLPIIKKCSTVQKFDLCSEDPEGSISFVESGVTYFVKSEKEVDAGAERQKIEEEIKYLEGFLNTIDKKLSNENFVKNAPAKVVEIEQQKKSDAEDKIEQLRSNLLQFN